jgi:hypothetical protein
LKERVRQTIQRLQDLEIMSSTQTKERVPAKPNKKNYPKAKKKLKDSSSPEPIQK